MPVTPHRRREPGRPAARLLTVLVAAMLALVVSAAAFAHAQTEDDLTWSLTPGDTEHGEGRPNFAYVVDPGDTVFDVLVVENASARTLPLDVYAADGFTTASGHLDLEAGDATPSGLGAWVTPELDTLSLEPGEQAEVPFALSVPEDAPPGDHPGGIVTSYLAAEDGGNVRVENRLALRIHVRVSGELATNLSVQDLTVTPSPSFNPFAPSTAIVRYRLVNDGNVRTFGHETVRVAGPGSVGSRSTTAIVDEIVPGSAIEREVEVTGVWPLVRLVGEVTIVPEAVGGAIDDPVEEHARAWAIPWGILGLVLLVVLVGVLIGVWRGRRADKAQGARDATADGASETASDDASGATSGTEVRAPE